MVGLACFGLRGSVQGDRAVYCFGLLMALVWARLHAPDIALAEATIGAGLTGALLLTALARRNHADREPWKQEQHDEE